MELQFVRCSGARRGERKTNAGFSLIASCCSVAPSKNIAAASCLSRIVSLEKECWMWRAASVLFAPRPMSSG